MKTANRKLRSVLGLALLLILACSLVLSGVLAKFTTEKLIANEADYTNTLAENFKLLDKPIKQNEDGSYAVDTDDDVEPTNGYTFKLIPGVTIPANPYIEIKGKTEIPAYLYLEIDRDVDVDLDLSGDWTLLDGIDGKKNGAVYVYKDAEPLTGEGGDDVLTIPTFTLNTLSKYPDDLDEGKIRVYAYLMQKVEDESASDTYAQAPAV